jgi:hypothetical protein
VVTDGFSNPESARRFADRFSGEPAWACQCFEDCHQCGGCAFFAPLNLDYGLCCHPDSRHHRKTVIEHFPCPSIADGGWGVHSFRKDPVAMGCARKPGASVAASVLPSRSARPWWRFW